MPDSSSPRDLATALANLRSSPEFPDPDPAAANKTFWGSVIEFSRRVLHRSYVLLPGIICGIFALVEFAGGEVKLPAVVAWGVIGGSMVVAFFWAFHDFRREKEAALAVQTSRIKTLEDADRRRENVSSRRRLVEKELSVIALEYEFLTHKEVEWEPGRKSEVLDVYKRTLSKFLDAVQGPATQSRFYWSDEQAALVLVDISRDIDPAKLPPDEDSVNAAIATRREHCGIYEDGNRNLEVAGLRIKKDES